VTVSASVTRARVGPCERSHCPPGKGPIASGRTRANNQVATLAADGSGNLVAFGFVTGSGSVDLILDVNGYFD